MATIHYPTQGRAVEPAELRQPGLPDAAALSLHDCYANLDAVLDAALEAVVGLDGRGVVTAWNRRAEELFGWTRAEAMGRALHDTIMARHAPDSIAHRLRALAGEAAARVGRDQNLLLASHRDGREFSIELALARLSVGAGHVFLGFVRSVAEEQLGRRLEAWQRELLEHVSLGLPLTQILAGIVERVEEVQPALLCSVLLRADGDKEMLVAAVPRLENFYRCYNHDLAPVFALAPCGKPADSCARRAMSDIASDSAWEQYRECAIRSGLQTCWQEPILGETGRPLGRFAIFLRGGYQPSHSDLALVAGVAKLAATIIDRHRVEEALQLATMVYQHSGEAMIVSDANNRIVAVNQAYTRLTGYTAAEVVGQNPRMMSSGRQDKAFYQALWQTLKATGRWQGEIWNRRKNGEHFAEWLSINTIRNEQGEVHRYVGFFADITDRKRSDELIWKQANYDLLTELPNRRLFRDRLDIAVKKSQRSGRVLGLLFVDLDHFKEVNDTLGDQAGDAVLVEAARRVRACVRESDTVGRLGSDELAVILSEIDGAANAEHVAQQLLRELALPYATGEQSTYLTASIGIALCPADADSADELLKHADQALSAAKADGRNRYSYCSAELQAQALSRMRLSGDLRVALAGGQLKVYFQPIVDLASGEVRKAEALLRWLHPEHGMIGPADFIPLAEESGIINEIGFWVFQESARWAERWSRLRGRCFQVSVNKSPVQFRAPNLLASWPDYLRQRGLPGGCINLEITEGLLLTGSQSIKQQLDDYRAAGIAVSIDDFGTGYSAMSYLKTFPIDYLKIDQSFVRDMASDPGDRAIAEAIIVMAHKLGIKVVAEGIETEEQRRLLSDAGCDFGQGYLFSRPVPPEHFECWMSERAAQTPQHASE